MNSKHNLFRYLFVFTLIIFLVACGSQQRVIPKDGVQPIVEQKVEPQELPKEEVLPPAPEPVEEEVEEIPSNFDDIINRNVEGYSFVGVQNAGGELDLAGVNKDVKSTNVIYEKDGVQSTVFVREYADPEQADEAGKQLFEILGRSYTFTVKDKFVISTLDDALIIAFGY